MPFRKEVPPTNTPSITPGSKTLVQPPEEPGSRQPLSNAAGLISVCQNGAVFMVSR